MFGVFELVKDIKEQAGCIHCRRKWTINVLVVVIAKITKTLKHCIQYPIKRKTVQVR